MFLFIRNYQIIFFIFFINILLPSCNFTQKTQVSNNHNPNINFKYIEGSQDIPLADGLEIISDDSVEFDTILGSFYSVNYSFGKDKNIIIDFYNNTLPKLGWQLSKASRDYLSFERDNQKLEIKFGSTNSENFVSFVITTKTK